MSQIIPSAYYRPTKSAWGSTIEPGQSVTNLARLNASESTSYTYLFSFELQSGSYFPDFSNSSYEDSNLRYSHYFLANPFDIANGGDLKWRGNYIHPVATLVAIDGDTNKTGALYHAGWNSSDGSMAIPLANRNWIEVLTNNNLASGLVADQLVSLTIEDGEIIPTPLGFDGYDSGFGYATWTWTNSGDYTTEDIRIEYSYDGLTNWTQLGIGYGTANTGTLNTSPIYGPCYFRAIAVSGINESDPSDSVYKEFIDPLPPPPLPFRLKLL